MDRRVSIEKHFEQKKFSSELSEDRDYKKYGMYIYKVNSLDDTGYGSYASGNTFFEMLANFSGVENFHEGDRYDILDKINFTFNKYTNFHDFHSDAFHYLSYIDDPFEFDFEKWAKLKVRDLYKYDIVSPFRYYMFTWEGVGVMPFYFRGQNIKLALKSFAFNHKRVTSHFYVNKMNYKTFVSDFYNFSTRVLGLNANPLGINTDNYWYNADRFLREAGFFEDASPKKALKESTYYKRRQLVV